MREQIVKAIEELRIAGELPTAQHISEHIKRPLTAVQEELRFMLNSKVVTRYKNKPLTRLRQPGNNWGYVYRLKGKQ